MQKELVSKILKKVYEGKFDEKRVYLAIFALTFGLCAGCGNKEAYSDISGTEDTVFRQKNRLSFQTQEILI